MNWQLIAIMGLAALLLISLMGLLRIIEKREEMRERAQRDVKLAALKTAGQDKSRTLDIIT